MAFLQGDDYGIRLNMDIIHQYNRKPAILPALASKENRGYFWVYHQKGWRAFLSFIWADIFVLIIILLVAVRVFPSEGKAAQILNTTPFGQRHTAAAKLLAVMLLALLLSLLFSILNLVLAAWKYGLGGVGASVLSLLPLSRSPLNLTIGQMAALFIVYRAFGAICSAIVVAAISYWLRGNLVSYIGAVVFMGGSYGYYTLFGLDPKLPMGLRLLPDVTIWTRPVWMFETYRVTNILSWPIQWVWICFAFWLFLSFGLFCCIIWHSERKGRPR